MFTSLETEIFDNMPEEITKIILDIFDKDLHRSPASTVLNICIVECVNYAELINKWKAKSKQ